MMKIKKSVKNRKYIALIIILIVAVLAACGIIAYSAHKTPSPTSQSTPTKNIDSPPTTDQQKAGETTKESSANSSSTNTTPTTQSPTVQMSITATNQNATTYQIRSLIEAVVNTGTCTLTLTQGTKSIEKTAGVQAEASTSTCEGFDIPLDQLDAGVWQLNLAFTNGTLTGSTTSSFTVN